MRDTLHMASSEIPISLMSIRKVRMWHYVSTAARSRGVCHQLQAAIHNIVVNKHSILVLIKKTVYDDKVVI